ncbi:hypothetical protein [Bifidobacterium simiarum]|uniref:hypothetical protein n=1 Tax=Bifidobacterium simiarum TaxID=2045441 RepID=UPI001BDBF6A2|nr:hypothetical protein [Bifidobacterium simiarum]MBT1167271.1 hypothetical protein [Bifidobacterium simiarum]
MNQRTSIETPIRVEPYERTERPCRCSLCADPIPAGRQAARLSLHDDTGAIIALTACTACLTTLAAMSRWDADGHDRTRPVHAIDRPAMTAWAGQTIARGTADPAQRTIGGAYLDRLQANTNR